MCLALYNFTTQWVPVSIPRGQTEQFHQQKDVCMCLFIYIYSSAFLGPFCKHICFPSSSSLGNLSLSLATTLSSPHFGNFATSTMWTREVTQDTVLGRSPKLHESIDSLFFYYWLQSHGMMCQCLIIPLSKDTWADSSFRGAWINSCEYSVPLQVFVWTAFIFQG
jgi:hypothetical protein